jgi:hypothetical protein
MDYKLEVVAVPVSDVDRSLAFYIQRSASPSTWTTARATASGSRS